MPLAPLTQKALLDWTLLGDQVQRPQGLWMALASATPNSTSAFEIGARQAATWLAA